MLIWPIEEFSIFSNGVHLGWCLNLSDTIKTGPLKDYFCHNWPSGFRWED